jgi:hypothetical protein
LRLVSSTGYSIELTEGHLINIKNRGYIRAHEVAIGDFLYADSSEIEVTLIEKITKRGYTAPLTKSGTLLVNNILASCYAEVKSQTVAHLAMNPISIWYDLNKFFGYQAYSQEGLELYNYIVPALHQFAFNHFESFLF